MLKLSEKTYLELNTTNKWQGVGKKAKGSVFLNANPTNNEPVFWNCGKKGHTINKCHQPKDPEAKIARFKVTKLQEDFLLQQDMKTIAE